MGGLTPNIVSALAPFVLVKVGAEIGAELDNIGITVCKTVEEKKGESYQY